tara:strand:+ start:274 stop:513 length:240 start_codon:yes stop_codon:yes gene_type:complete
MKTEWKILAENPEIEVKIKLHLSELKNFISALSFNGKLPGNKLIGELQKLAMDIIYRHEVETQRMSKEEAEEFLHNLEI